jgi:hypothetical protein
VVETPRMAVLGAVKAVAVAAARAPTVMEKSMIYTNIYNIYYSGVGWWNLGL